MRDEKANFDQRGAKIVVIGHGAPHFARAFAEDLRPGFPIYTDPSKKSYDAAGFEHGLSTVLNLGSLKHSLRSFSKGHKTGLVPQGDALQQGGVLVVAPPDRLLYHFVSHEAGGHAPIAEILASLPSTA